MTSPRPERGLELGPLTSKNWNKGDESSLMCISSPPLLSVVGRMLGVEFLAVLHSAEETRPQQEVERVLMQILHPGIHAAARELTILPSIHLESRYWL